MCKHKKSSNKKIDKCIETLIFRMKQNGIKTLACCCGHKRYHMTIVVKDEGGIYDMVSDVEIVRKKRFYVKDKNGLYYIPEVENHYREHGKN